MRLKFWRPKPPEVKPPTRRVSHYGDPAGRSPLEVKAILSRHKETVA